MHHFAVLVVEKVPNLQPLHSKSTVRALLLRDGLSMSFGCESCMSDTVICAEQ